MGRVRKVTVILCNSGIVVDVDATRDYVVPVSYDDLKLSLAGRTEL